MKKVFLIALASATLGSAILKTPTNTSTKPLKILQLLPMLKLGFTKETL